MSGLSVLTWNIANPSADRAQRQLEWLATRDEGVFVLTETKNSDGCALLAESFQAAGYSVVYPKPAPGEYGTLIASTVSVTPEDWSSHLTLSARAVSAIVPTDRGPLRITGVYVPSRDASQDKTDRKRTWLSQFRAALADHPAELTLLLGDFNVLEPDHQPQYRQFLPFEYDFYRALGTDHDLTDAYRLTPRPEPEHSWVGRTGDGYRYDHVFCSTSLTASVLETHYVHAPRVDEPRLSDHSALTTHLNITPTTLLVTSDPSTAASPPTLF